MKLDKHLLIGLFGMAALTAAAVIPQADAQAASSVSEFERPYGYAYGQESQPYSGYGRDANGNRVVINGMIDGGTGLGTSLYTGWGQTDGAAGMIGTGTAIGTPTGGSRSTFVDRL